jgi:hypothetical protein
MADTKLRGGNSEIPANLTCEEIVDFRMPRNARGCSRFRIEIDRVPRSLAQQIASVTCEVMLEITPFHLQRSYSHNNWFSSGIRRAVSCSKSAVCFENQGKGFL